MNTLEILESYFHFKQFRPLQNEIVSSIISGHDTLALLPTGGGKSICYQVPGLYFFQNGGVTLVISPLIALMKDQVDNLIKKNIPAVFINHSLTETELQQHLEEVANKKFAFIYVSPERLATPQFSRICQNLPIKLIAVDEAHCISQWGHDFRPEYLQINQFIKKLPLRPIVAAFTATAPPIVKKEVVTALKLVEPTIFQDTFFRSNLYFQVINCQNAQKQELLLLKLVKKHLGQSGIIYCATRAKTEQVARFLQHFQVTCAFYHGGIEPKQRAQTQEAYLENKIKIIAATNAFGMGVDKPDISFVIHFNFPAHLEAYYQEAGRAGRSGQLARCYLLFQAADLGPQLSLISNQTSAQRIEISKQKLIKMIEYCQIQTCRTVFLLRYLGEKNNKQSCVNCDICTSPKSRNHETNRKLEKLFKHLQKKRTLFPILSYQLMQYFILSQPKTKRDYLQLPGIGQKWLQKYYAFFAVELLENVLLN